MYLFVFFALFHFSGGKELGLGDWRLGVAHWASGIGLGHWALGFGERGVGIGRWALHWAL